MPVSFPILFLQQNFKGQSSMVNIKSETASNTKLRNYMHIFSENFKLLKISQDNMKWTENRNMVNYADLDELLNAVTNNIMHCINIGAKAEKRSEEDQERMKNQIVQYSEENKEFLKDISDKDELISALSKELYQKSEMDSTYIEEVSKLKEQLCQTKKDKLDTELLIAENLELKKNIVDQNKELDSVRAELLEILRMHEKCHFAQNEGSGEEKVEKLFLNTEPEEISQNKQSIRLVKEQNYVLQKEVSKLNKELEQSFQKKWDFSRSYKKLISELQTHISELNQELAILQEELKKKYQAETRLTEEIDILGKEANRERNDNERNVKLVEKFEEHIKNLQAQIENLMRKHSNEIAQFKLEIFKQNGIVAEQQEEIDFLKNVIRNSTTCDVESEELLNEVLKVQNEVCESANKSTCKLRHANQEYELELLSRIKKIRNHILPRLSYTEIKKEELSGKLEEYRCEFAEIQDEIFQLRVNGSNRKEAIIDRVRKEDAISFIITQTEKERNLTLHRYESLEKALVNLEKIDEFVRNLKL